MQNLLWFKDQKQDSGSNFNVLGSYVSHVHGTSCTLELCFQAGSVFRGSFCYDEDILDVTASLSERTGYLHGFLLEPSLQAPVAFFRARLNIDGLALELDVPDFDELIDQCQLERISLARVKELSRLS